MVVRTRFAPSPTGFLHIGGVRTALFSWLYARHCGGEFVLRIEDTDKERSTSESVEAILAGMAWLGLDYDQGPFYQSERYARYHEIIETWLEKGLAYRCYCSKERLQQLRDGQMAKKQKPRYDGHCLEHSPPSADQPFVVRFKNPATGSVVFDDVVRGRIIIDNCELDDMIIARQDGSPTYNFTVVVDDSDMGITHVIRGDDHINNTPRQINLLHALGTSLPIYAHVPMILGPDGQRLSKRHGAVSVLEYKEQGILPQALLNYLVRLGWSQGDKELFTREEMIEAFDLQRVNRSSAAVNSEKLIWLNQHYLKHTPRKAVAEVLRPLFAEKGVSECLSPDLTAVIDAQCERVKTVVELRDRSLYFYQEPAMPDEKLLRKHCKWVVKPAFDALIAALRALPKWHKEAIHDCLQSTAEAHGLKLGKIAQPVRLAITGTVVSPPIDITLELIGQERTLLRLEKACTFFKEPVAGDSN